MTDDYKQKEGQLQFGRIMGSFGGRQVRLAFHAGFCFGVKAALEKTQDTIKTYGKEEKRIYTCGPLIHNRSVTDGLKRQGVCQADSPKEMEEGSVVIVRSHGESRRFYEEAGCRKLQVVDATCPFVQRIHRLAKEAWEAGRTVVVVGDSSHPEVRGICGWTDDQALVVGNLEEARGIAADHISLMAQTTITAEVWDEIAAWFESEKEDVIIHRTICSATGERQSSCAQTAQWADAMVVIGGKNSSNSQKLYQIAKKFCKNTVFVEGKEDLPLKDVELCNRIGIAAGASTPERIIKEVISTMCEVITENKEQEVQEVEVKEVQETAVKEEPIAEAVPEQEEEKNGMHALMDEIEKSLRLPGRGEIVTGEVVQVSNREIVVNLGCKKDGIIPKDEMIMEEGKELTEMFQEGDSIQAKVIKTDDGDGNILLSKKKLEVNAHWDEINGAFENREIVNAKVVREVKGGVIAVYKEVSGFIPMSQLSDHYVEKADEFIGKTLLVKVSRVDQRRNKAVFSHKAYLAEEKAKKVQEIWGALNIGDTVEGTVMRFTDYGAFVDIGGIDGLLHISEISWGKLKHPQEALEIGQKINVKILSMNEEKGKISLGLKQNQPEPWSVIDDKYTVGQVISGKVVQIKDYGAFVELEPGLDGLVHISEIAYKRVTNIADEISVGQEVNAKILDIDRERRRISLSIKETLEPPIFDEQEEAPFEETEESTEE